MNVKRHILTDKERCKGSYKRRLSAKEKTVRMSVTLLESRKEKALKRGGSGYVQSLIEKDNPDLSTITLCNTGNDLEKMMDQINKLVEKGGEGE